MPMTAAMEVAEVAVPATVPVGRIEPHTEASITPIPDVVPVTTAIPPAPAMTTKMTSSTPGNLPFADDAEFSWAAQLPGLATKTIEEAASSTEAAPVIVETAPVAETAISTEASSEEVPKPAQVEPTDEELKRRLNQLLRGGKI